MVKSLKGFIVGILVCIAVYIGVFIGRNSMSNTLNISASRKAAEDKVIDIIDLNKATTDDLCTLPGVGPKLARSIIEYRNQYGDYVAVKELLDIEGMSNKLYEEIKAYVTVN